MPEIKPEGMDSDEERHFYSWLLEAEETGIVSDIEYQPRSFELSPRASMKIEKQLKTKTKMVDKFLLHPHKYTTDFSFEWHGMGSPFVMIKGMCWVDVKGTFNKYGDPKQFSINQKWIYQKYGIFINKVVPQKLFLKTFCPEACRYTPKRRDPVKKYIGTGTIHDFIERVK